MFFFPLSITFELNGISNKENHLIACVRRLIVLLTSIRGTLKAEYLKATVVEVPKQLSGYMTKRDINNSIFHLMSTLAKGVETLVSLLFSYL